jgi:hypothetical protein
MLENIMKKTAARQRAPGAGRPSEVAETRPVTVTLDRATIDKARKVGAGNVSRGIRMAIAGYPKNEIIVKKD